MFHNRATRSMPPLANILPSDENATLCTSASVGSTWRGFSEWTSQMHTLLSCAPPANSRPSGEKAMALIGAPLLAWEVARRSGDESAASTVEQAPPSQICAASKPTNILPSRGAPEIRLIPRGNEVFIGPV